MASDTNSPTSPTTLAALLIDAKVAQRVTCLGERRLILWLVPLVAGAGLREWVVDARKDERRAPRAVKPSPGYW